MEPRKAGLQAYQRASPFGNRVVSDVSFFCADQLLAIRPVVQFKGMLMKNAHMFAKAQVA
jgi:hypothetical protein